MTGLRWGLGAGLGALALVAAGRALTTYLGHGLWLGAGAVLVLLAMLLYGFRSLWRARGRLGRELAGLAAEPPRGEWVQRREALLRRLHAAGERPDANALAEAASAEERGEAYLGRYFVATSVLVGLVGTFAGLMETLRAVAPLLQDEKTSTLALFAAPLAGLDVTFGASITGILVTLALALVQGDVAIAEELALARLEERTAHVLMPALWPRARSAEARAAQDLAALRDGAADAAPALSEALAQLRTLAEASSHLRAIADTTAWLPALTEKIAERLSEAIAPPISTLLARFDAALGEQRDKGAALTQAIVTQTVDAQRAALAGFEARAQEMAAAFAGSAERTQALQQDAARALEGLGAETAHALREMTAAHAEALSQQTEAARVQHEQARDAAREGAARIEARIAETGAAIGALEERLAGAAEEYEGSLRATAEGLLDAHSQTLRTLMEAHVSGLGAALQDLTAAGAGALSESAARAAGVHEALERTGARLAEAASQIGEGAERFAPAVAALTPELSALTSEIALLASQVGDAEAERALMGELARVAESIAEVKALLTLGAEERA